MHVLDLEYVVTFNCPQTIQIRKRSEVFTGFYKCHVTRRLGKWGRYPT